MILIADSGSTKTDWAIIEGESHSITQTLGFNPMLQSSDFIKNEIGENQALQDIAGHITTIYYYGASCSSDERIKKVKDALKANFTNAVQIEIHHDIDAAVYATCENKAGVSCILGTGSNCVFYNGKTIQSFTSALGYILGDEASGAYFGIQLAKDFINQKMPQAMHHHFRELGFEKNQIFKAVYEKENPNRFLASLTKKVANFKDLEYTQNLLYKGFEDFIHTHVLAIESAAQYPIHFVGSIAFHFKDILEKALKANGLTLGNIVTKPIENLIKHHS